MSKSSADQTKAAAARASAIGLDVFYPIVPDVDWLKRLAPLGIRTVQLRLKDSEPAEVNRQISESLKICADHGCTLIVNDYWAEALDHGASFLHLGQEDLADADLARIKSAGAKLGLSTHSLDELDVALEAEPDYIALGPIYETRLKVMKWAPQGLGKLGIWRDRIGDLPLVGIAGITVARADGVLDAGANSAAVITDFLTHAEPEARVREWLAWADTRRTPDRPTDGVS